jgi:hypothetical protein
MKNKIDIEFFPNCDYCGVKSHYDSHQAHDHDERCKNDYCRCSTIKNTGIDSVDMSEVLDRVMMYWELDSEDEILVYCVDRILRHFELWDIHNWQVNVCGGYYGEEVDSVTPPDTLQEEIIKNVKCMYESDNKIEYVLQLEYGNVLPQLQNKKWSIVTVPKSDVILGNGDYMKRVPKERCYTEYKGIVAVCTKEENKYRLWDGYHRYVTTTDKQIKILVGE